MKTGIGRTAGLIAAVAVAAAAGGFAAAKFAAWPEGAQEPAKAAGEADGAGGTVALTAQAARDAGIALETVHAGALAAEVTGQGSVVGAPDGEAVLTAHAPGTVTRIFRRLGDAVRAGEPLAMLESREAAQIAADASAAAAKATLANSSLAREKALYDERVSPRADYEQAQAEAGAAAAELRRARAAAAAAGLARDGRGVAVVSPIAGRVTAGTPRLGSFVQAETELFRVADPRRVQIEAAISAIDAGRVKPGDRAMVERPEGGAVEARVRSVTPTLSAQTRAATAVLDLQGGELTSGSAVRARISTGGAATSRLLIPDEAVQAIGGHDAVFVQTANGFRVAPVVLGARSAGRAEVIMGLKDGEVVAVRNAFLLKAELGKGAGGDDD